MAAPTSSAQPRRIGLLAFLAFCCGLSWLPVALMGGSLATAEIPGSLRLLVASALYAFWTGWQPIIAMAIVERWIDPEPIHSARPRARHFVFAWVAAVAMAGAAMLVAWWVERDIVEPAGALTPSFRSALLLIAVMGATFTLVWFQALAEEMGWRGYFLPVLMRELGPLPGLGAHGVLWGLWYSPIVFLCSAPSEAPERAFGFVVTCTLLGTLLGCLRLVLRSPLPGVLGNAVLTLTAGLPLVLTGQNAGIRASVYEPLGWLPLGALALLVIVRYRKDLARADVLFRPPRARVRLLALSARTRPRLH
jgi:membrane protease YdiL (CAAX protease family)